MDLDMELDLSIDDIYDTHFREIMQFEEFHVAFIDFWRFLTSLFLQTQYSMPTAYETKVFYDEWKTLEGEQRKTRLYEFISNKVSYSNTSDATLVAGIVAPITAVIFKKTWKKTPLLNIIPLHFIPNFIFVPSFTMLALIGVKVVYFLKRLDN